MKLLLLATMISLGSLADAAENFACTDKPVKTCQQVAVFVGHPDKLVQLKPDPDFLRTQADEAFWLVCRYGASGAKAKLETVAKPLPGALTLCQVVQKSKSKCPELQCS